MNQGRVAATLFAIILAAGVEVAQSPASPTAVTPARTSASAHPHHHARARTTQVIRRETAPAGATANQAPGPDQTQQQRATDQRILQRQQAQSAHAAAVNNQVVQQFQQQQQKIQNEVRIQDAPGPAQTGVVPAAGPPVAPVNADDRIQDAPGPAQTLPKLPATTPASNSNQSAPPQF